MAEELLSASDTSILLNTLREERDAAREQLDREALEVAREAPSVASLVVRIPMRSTQEERERVLRLTEYNVFSFPAEMVTVDLLSDSGTTAMTAEQWGAMLWGDEAYGRNRGYFYLLESLRDTFERGDHPERRLKYAIGPCDSMATMIEQLYVKEYSGGFVNGGVAQLTRPNCFLVPQGRCAEYLLFATMAEVRKERGLPLGTVLSNGWFDTTAAHAAASGFLPLNVNVARDQLELGEVGKRNPFNGNVDINALRQQIETLRVDNVPLIVITVTNNTCAGQPVSLQNIRETAAVAKEYGIPLFMDACRFAENAYFVQQYEEECKGWSVPRVIQEMFRCVDGFTLSLKKDGLANIGGVLSLRDRGVFHSTYSTDAVDIGIRMKEKQILCYGNDSYGAMTGRDIMAATMGLYTVVKSEYLEQRVSDVQYLAVQLSQRGVPVVLPPGGHAVYVDMNRFFDHKKPWQEYGGVALCIELIRLFGIRACELGPFAFEWDLKSEAEREGIEHLVRLAVPRNVYSRQHMDYVAQSVAVLHKYRRTLPVVTITRGKTLRLRHFQSGLGVNYA